MRRQLVFLCTLFFSVQVLAQIPNNGFESWDNSACPYLTDSVPAGWTSPCTNALVFTASLAATSDAYEGNWACLLPPLDDGLTLTYGGSYINLKMPISEIPHYFQGYYKYFTQVGDSAQITAYFTKFNSQTLQTDTLYIFSDYLYGVNQYTQFSIDFTGYSSLEIADTIDLYIASSSLNFGHIYGINNSEGSDGILYIDAVEFSGTVDIEKRELEGQMFYPNPAFYNIQFACLKPDWSHYKIYDITGALVSRNSISKTIELKFLQPGNYLLSIYSKEGMLLETQRLLKQ